MEQVEVVENFYGVYLLKSLNEKYKAWTYIGYTVDPNRRIKQHNRGKKHGGAWRTSMRGPWEMVLIVHGFPTSKIALKFEWAWQHPTKSKKIRNRVTCKKKSETTLDYKIRLMFIMLSAPPWNRLPLTIRWLSADSVVDAPPHVAPPRHMPVVYGSVIAKKCKRARKGGKAREEAKSKTDSDGPSKCQICWKPLSEKDSLDCVNANCKGSWHILCIADVFLADEQLRLPISVDGCFEKRRKRIIPVEGPCPQCKLFILWGDLIKKKQGCYIDANKRFCSSE